MRGLPLFNAPLLLVLGVSAALAAEQPGAPLELLGNIPLPGVSGRLDHMAADVYNSRLFLAALDNNTIEVLDIRSNTVIASIAGVAKPQGIAYSHSANRLFVANGGDGTLRIYDGATFKPLRSLRLGSDADNIRLDENNQRLYVGYGEGAIAVLDGAGKRLADIPLPAHPESFQLSLKEPKLFVNLPGARSVATFDLQNFKSLADWPVRDGAENFPMTLDEANNRLFVVCRRPARLLVFNMGSGRVIARLPAPGDADDVFFDPIHARLYVTGGEGRIGVYAQQSADSYAEIAEIASAVGARTSLFVPEWNRFFVAGRERGGEPAQVLIYQPK